MRGISRLAAAATVGGLALLGLSRDIHADGPGPAVGPVNQAAPAGSGSIHGVVRDESGAPLGGALVTAVGTSTPSYAITDSSGRFELRTLSPGVYLLRAHSIGFITAAGQKIEVQASSRTSSSIALKRASPSAASSSAITATAIPANVHKAAPPAPILRAGVGLTGGSSDAAAAKPVTSADDAAASGADQTSPSDDDHSELAWRLRHLRRSVLQDRTEAAFDPENSSPPEAGQFDQARLGRPDGSPLRQAANLFAGAPLSGEVNFLTTSSFDAPQQLFNGDMSARNVAYMSVGAPAGSKADWGVRGALSQADISSWVIAGTYSSHGPTTRHQYDLGLSYATQRYDGGNPAALRDVTDGSRNAGAIYGFDTWTVSPTLAVTYGARYARYDYLEDKALVSPRVSATLSAGDRFRVAASMSRRSIAPGAEEFLPPGESGIWLPPQRTFSSFVNGGPLEAEHTTHGEVGVERDLGQASSLTVRAFQQYVTDQLVTMFGVNVPGMPPATLGHYFVGNYGDVDARGIAAGLRTVAGRVHCSVDYSVTRAQWKGVDNLDYWILRMPDTPPRPEQLHSVSTSIQTDVPETSTRVIMLYRVSNALVRQSLHDDRMLDTRFDVEVHQSLPFMDFSTAKWEMLLGVRNFFRETAADQSVFDELLVVHPPKRIVGGLTMKF
jgi:hypothetical protein